MNVLLLSPRLAMAEVSKTIVLGAGSKHLRQVRAVRIKRFLGLGGH